MILTALIVMIASLLAQHLGLTDAVSKILTKILKCPRCLSFWAVLAVLLWLRCNLIIAMGLSILMAYLSVWIGMLLVLASKLYDRLWQKNEKNN